VTRAPRPDADTTGTDPADPPDDPSTVSTAPRSPGTEPNRFPPTTPRQHAERRAAFHRPVIDDILRDPFEGIGKPEPLRHAFAGSWSRRISEEHRLVYLLDGDDIVILQARYHYS
jgi:Txe/YoeB family toxin of toxin-antitoxin system